MRSNVNLENLKKKKNYKQINQASVAVHVTGQEVSFLTNIIIAMTRSPLENQVKPRKTCA